MPAHVLLTLSNPVAGQESAYLTWYRNEHLAEVVALDGFTAATLYALSNAQLPGFPPSGHQYLCVYEIEGDVARALEALHGSLASGEIVIPAVIEREEIRPWAFSRISDRCEKGG